MIKMTVNASEGLWTPAYKAALAEAAPSARSPDCHLHTSNVFSSGCTNFEDELAELVANSNSSEGMRWVANRMTALAAWLEGSIDAYVESLAELGGRIEVEREVLRKLTLRDELAKRERRLALQRLRLTHIRNVQARLSAATSSSTAA